MMTNEYLDAVKERHGLTSDYQLAKLLESSTPVISQYRHGKRVMDDYTAARVAELLGIDPMIVIAQANSEREKDAKKRDYWRKFAAAASVMLIVSSFMTVTPQTAHASTTCSGSNATDCTLWRFELVPLTACVNAKNVTDT